MAVCHESKTVPVIVQKVRANTPLGHAVIKVGEGAKVGLVPTSVKGAVASLVVELVTSIAINLAIPSSVPGSVEPSTAKIKDTATLFVTPAQAKAMQNNIDHDVAHPPRWDPGYGDCAVWVGNVLRSGGVNAPMDVTPGGLVDDLKKLK